MLDTEESRDALSELHDPNVIYCWDMSKYGHKIDNLCRFCFTTKRKAYNIEIKKGRLVTFLFAYTHESRNF